MHWTQKPENKARLREIQKLSVLARQKPSHAKRNSKRRLTKAEFRHKISQGMKASHARRRELAQANGHATPAAEPPAVPSPAIVVPIRLHARGVAKASLNALALDGAKLRLVNLDQEREMLQIVIRSLEKR